MVGPVVRCEAESRQQRAPLVRYKQVLGTGSDGTTTSVRARRTSFHTEETVSMIYFEARCAIGAVESVFCAGLNGACAACINDLLLQSISGREVYQECSGDRLDPPLALLTSGLPA